MFRGTRNPAHVRWQLGYICACSGCSFSNPIVISMSLSDSLDLPPLWYTTVDRYLGYFHASVIVNNASMNTRVQRSLWDNSFYVYVYIHNLNTTIYNYLKEIAVCVCIALLNRNGNSIGNFLTSIRFSMMAVSFTISTASVISYLFDNRHLDK